MGNKVRCVVNVTVIAMMVLLLASGAGATKGRRQGCLAVGNRIGEGITVYTNGASQNGSWHFAYRTGAVLEGDQGPITVDEDTVLWIVSDGGMTTDHMSLLEDPNTVYSTDTSNALKACRSKPGIWMKIFGGGM